jgi:protein SCO1/2
MNDRSRALTKGLLIFTAILALVLLYSLLVLLDKQKMAEQMAQGQASEHLPVLHSVTPFALTDSTGQPFTEARVSNVFWVADFIFTSCPGQCKEMSANMAMLQSRLSDLTEVEFVSISVDPVTDTPEQLRAYAARYEADTNRWHFLTGDINDVKRFSVEGLRIGTHDDPNLHSDRFVMIDHHMQIRGYYSGIETGALTRLERDLRKLIREHAHD